MSSTYPYNSTGTTVSHSEASESVIDQHSHFDGLYRTSNDLRIEGTAEGEIQCDGTLTIAENASVTATVHARNVTVAGSASGEITCQERITILPTGEVLGTLRAASLKVEEGAFFEGEFRMIGSDDASDAPLGNWGLDKEEAASLNSLDQEIGLNDNDEADDEDEDDEEQDEDEDALLGQLELDELDEDAEPELETAEEND